MKKTWGFWVSTAWLVLIVAAAWLLPLLLPGDPFQPVADPLLLPHAYPPLGTDALGRDFMIRIVFGSRTTLNAGILAASITIFSGLVLSLTASFFGGWIDLLILGSMNAALAIPGLLFALLLTASMGPGFGTVILAVGFGLVPGYARLARTVFQQVRQAVYILAARALGMSPLRIALYHILPNAIRGVASFSALHFSWAIMGITTLTFLGLSGDPSIPEWGAMLDSGRQHLQTAPHLALIPGALISLTILAVYRLSEEIE
ncbi:MAG: ABC transporter permease [Anaerolineales bacterium]|nr:ABC transporter permease [Anaerolineales bacterium]